MKVYMVEYSDYDEHYNEGLFALRAEAEALREEIITDDLRRIAEYRESFLQTNPTADSTAFTFRDYTNPALARARLEQQYQVVAYEVGKRAEVP